VRRRKWEKEHRRSSQGRFSLESQLVNGLMEIASNEAIPNSGVGLAVIVVDVGASPGVLLY
jgi:hypothetical protein